MSPNPGSLRHVRESTVAVVAIEEVWRPGIVLGVAVIAPPCRVANWVGADTPAQIVDHEQVQQPIVVVVEPCPGDSPQVTEVRVCGTEPGCRGDVAERAIAIVAIQRVAVQAGYEEVLVAIVVVVGRRSAEVKPLPGEPGSDRDIRETRLAVVFEQSVVEAFGGLAILR